MTTETSEPSEQPAAGGTVTAWLVLDLVLAIAGLAMAGIGLAFFDWRIALIVVGTVIAAASYWSN